MAVPPFYHYSCEAGIMKEVRNYYDEFDTCREHDIPMCADACPFKLDILTLQERIEGKRLNAAYKTVRDAVVFPGIVSEICPEYCRHECIRKDFDEPLQLRKLEQAVCAGAKRKDPNRYNLPAGNARVAVVGAGLSGMAFALKMAGRKYSVTVYEKKDRIGGSLAELMDEEAYMAEFDLQFRHEKYTLVKEKTASEEELLAGNYDVIYVATGRGGDSFGISGSCREVQRADGGRTGMFAGGSLKGKDMMHALADGIRLAASADMYIRTGRFELPEEGSPSRCVADTDRISAAPAVKSDSAYTEEEAAAEASRCIRCRCSGCTAYCDLVDFYAKSPVKMRDEVFLSVKPAGSLVHKSPARKYIAACTDCRIMEETTCPEHIQLCSMIKAARHQMHAADKMPAAYKQYFVRDMEFANGRHAALIKNNGGRYAFFPGCSLGALDPEYVIRPYKWLMEKYPDTSMLLKCCSVPVDWAGNTQAHEAEIRQLERDWEMLGRPVLITACMSCEKHLREYLPQIETVTIYQLLAEAFEERADADEEYAVFDPCSARDNRTVQKYVRDIVYNTGMSISELPGGDRHGCCGFGGQGAVAQPGFAGHVAAKRAGMSDKPYLVYCSNCRDVFTGQGKKAIHIFDALFGIDPQCRRRPPGVTGRRENRVRLKARLLKEIWGEDMTDKPERLPYELVMGDEVAAAVEAERIIAEDICAVIAKAEETGRRTRNPENGHFKAYDEIGAITLWVEYGGNGGNRREIFKVYSHRMQIKLEAVFNGRKVDL